MFNLIVDLLAFVFLLPVLPALFQWLDLHDPLYRLVAFHSTFNVLGLCLFIPFLRPYSNWIGQQFVADKVTSVNLADVPVTVPEAAINACQRHVKDLMITALAINLRNLRIPVEQLTLSPAALSLLAMVSPSNEKFERRYEILKQSEGDLLRYSTALQRQALEEDQGKHLFSLLDCARDTVYATKTLKDIRPDLVALRHADTGPLKEFSESYQSNIKTLYARILELLSGAHEADYLHEQLEELNRINEQIHEELDAEIRQSSGEPVVTPEQLSTLLNVNREVWHSGRNLLRAIAHWYDMG